MPQSSHFSAIVFPTRLSVAAGNFALRSSNTEPFILTDALSTAKPAFVCLFCMPPLDQQGQNVHFDYGQISGLAKIALSDSRGSEGRARIAFILVISTPHKSFVVGGRTAILTTTYCPILGLSIGIGRRPTLPAEPFGRPNPSWGQGHQMTLSAKRLVRFWASNNGRRSFRFSILRKTAPVLRCWF